MKEEARHTEGKMRATLDYRDRFLCVLIENGVEQKKWFPVHRAECAEVKALLGRAITCINQQEGIYVDEEGNVYEFANKGGTEPIAVEHLPGKKKTELEVLLAASLNGGQERQPGKDSKRARRRMGNNGRKGRRTLQVVSTAPESASTEAPPTTDTSGAHVNGEGPENLAPLNLYQKLAEVRRRMGYIQKRGHNERSNYSYVTAADIAGAVGDLLSQLGVVVVPSLDSISYEPVRTSNGQVERVAHVVMTYTFTDVDTAEAVTVKVPGEGLDAGDKAPYKAMTGALKYALLQSFLLATGDDPEEERITPSASSTHQVRTSDRVVTAEEACELRQLIEDTGTELERVLAYYKVASLEEMTESAYRRAVEVLNRKLAKRGNQETVHVHD